VEVQFAKVSLTGHRADNQDRVEVVQGGPSVLLIVVDGMGGHSDGALASEVTIESVSQRFRAAGQPVLDPQGFLIAALAAAHDSVVALGTDVDMEHRPRATCAVGLVQDDNLFCAHIGDSRIYQLRGKRIVFRTRDHSHVELLLHEGVIQESEVNSHPMRNYVECCLGGSEPLPDMSIAGRQRLAAGDVVLICSDGLWTGISEDDLSALTGQSSDLAEVLQALAELAVQRNEPNSDNTSAVALRCLGTER
jgi:serine/threonine protein phosphatase PrpC